MNYNTYIAQLQEDGHSIIDNIYTETEVRSIIKCLENAELKEDSYQKNNSLYAIRQLLKNIPELETFLFNQKLKELLFKLFNGNSFLSKAIYFDKPKESNWFVAYHQDLSILVNQKQHTKGYSNWTFKKGLHGVQPPTEILNNIVTIRIHLDDTTMHNGALKVIPKSHKKGIQRIDSFTTNKEDERFCELKIGSVMLMKPLLFHASNRTTNQQQRRVIHLEFSNQPLAKPLEWLEYLEVK